MRNTPATNPTTAAKITSLIVSILICFAAAALGAFFPPDQWYANLSKPTWAPPNWIFGPVWTVLYLMMAIAAWLVWQEHQTQKVRHALILFVIQLLLNAAWSWLFFGRHRIDLALADICVLLTAIVATTFAFHRIRPIAGQLMIPYWLWVGFATMLNLAFWDLNP